MLTVFLSVHGTIFINWLLPAESFNSGYFYQQILEPSSQTLHSKRATGSPRPIAHCDDATPHRSAGSDNCLESCHFRHARQPPHSTDISPCDSFLFGDLKTELGGGQFDTMAELQRGLEELLGQVTSDAM
jgi:hypothetical protein